MPKINTKLAYEVHGSGQPVYFLHGMSMARISMTSVYEPIIDQAKYQRYYIDLPGMGESQNVTDIHSSDDVVALLARFIEQTADNQPVLLVGHSYGGYLCYALTQILTNVAGIFTTCPVVVAASAKRHVAEHRTKVVTPVENDGSAAMQGYLAMNVVISPTTWHAYQQQILPGLAQFNAAFWNQIKQTGHYALKDEAHLFEHIVHVNYPLYTLLGRRDNIVGYEDHLARLQEAPTSKIIMDDDAGHDLSMDDPALVASAWQKFTNATSPRN